LGDFQVIYKILRLLQKNRGREDFDYAQISAQAMKLDFADWEQLMIEMQEDGLIRGLVYVQTLSDKFPHITEPIRPAITLKGLEYLAENSAMNKAKEMLRMIGEII